MLTKDSPGLRIIVDSTQKTWGGDWGPGRLRERDSSPAFAKRHAKENDAVIERKEGWNRANGYATVETPFIHRPNII